MADVQKVFDVYWVMAVNDSAIPIQFHKDTHTLYNETNRMNLSLNGHQADVYISVSIYRPAGIMFLLASPYPVAFEKRSKAEYF